MLKTILKSAAVAAAAIMLFVPTGSDARTLDEIIKSGTVKVGTTPNLPPLSSRTIKGDWEGFDIDIAKLLAAKMGVKIEFVPTDVPARVPAVVGGLTDFGMGAITRNSRRMKVVDFTVPLHTENLAVLLTDKVKGVTKWQDLNDPKYTLTGCRGCGPVRFVKANVPKAKLLLVDNPADMVRSVAQGRANGLIANLDFYPALLRAHPSVNWVILPNIIKTSYCSIAVAKGNHSLLSFLNSAMWEIQDPGTHNDLWEKHYGVPPIVAVKAQPYW
jgi:polar amino acid transport system substrate-binding protein